MWPPDGPPPPGGSASDGPARPLPPELDPRGRPRGSRPLLRRLRYKRILAWGAGATAVVVLLAAVTGWAAFQHFMDGVTRINPFCSHCARPSGGVQGDENILLVGSDSRAGLTKAEQHQLHVGHDAGQRSDTMILLHIPRGGGKAVLVSLPRDSYVQIPAHKDSNGHEVPAQMNKLNTAYSFGGAALTVRTVEANTHVRIDHYIEVNFLGFTKIVDALGGVTVCTPTPINDPVHYDPATGGYVGSGLQLPAGRTTVNGVRALEYVRAREFDPRADLGRIERQQKFMSAMIQKAKSTGVLLNPVRLYDVIGAVSHSLTTDEGFGAEQIYTLLMHLRSMSPAHVQMLTVPLEPGSFNTPVGNVVKWDPVASRQLFRDLSEDKPIGGHGAHKVTIPPSSIALKVLNATTTNGFAAKAAQDLAARGFRISGTGNAPNGSDPNTTVVRYGPSRADSAKTVAASVPGAKLVQDPSLGAGVELVLGHDYKGTAPVKVAADTQNGNPPRTAAQDVCS